MHFMQMSESEEPWYKLSEHSMKPAESKLMMGTKCRNKSEVGTSAIKDLERNEGEDLSLGRGI